MICRFAVSFASADALAGRTLQGGAGEGALAGRTLQGGAGEGALAGRTLQGGGATPQRRGGW